MQILWIVNKIFPYPSKMIGMSESVFGGWLDSLAENLSKVENVKLAICALYNGNKVLKYENENIVYYLLPGAPGIKYDKKLEQYWKKINDEFKPHLVHIHGTEYAHGLAYLNVSKNIKNVVSIQGLVSACEKVYLSNLSKNQIIKNITLRDIVKNDTLFNQKKKFKKRGKNEIKIIEQAENVIGRTGWDYSNVMAINPNIKYYIGNEILRKSFYLNKWTGNNIEEKSIFCSQAGYPIKGFHYLLEAIYILKKLEKDVKLYVAGPNILDESKMGKIKRSGYSQYIKSLIEKYDLKENVIFTGLLNEKEIIDRLLKTHVFVLPSVLENSSNSLCEAMLLGMPCVSTCSGGILDILENKKEGFLYPYNESAMCAQYIQTFFENKALCIECGKKAREKALKRHNVRENVKQLLGIYNEIIKN